MNEGKILAIVLEVAPHAVPAIGILHPEERVVALMRGQAVGNFLMAFEAFEGRRAGSELVARVALRRAIEGLVRFRERPGRNLGTGTGAAKESDERQQSAEEARRIDSPDTRALRPSKEIRQQLPPTNSFWREHRRSLDSNLARTVFRQTHEPTNCAFPAKLVQRTGKV